MYIRDLVPDVIAKLRGRTDLSNQIVGWIRDAILDLTENIEFEELKRTGPLTNFIAGQSTYPLNYFVNQEDKSKKWTLIPSWFVYYAGTVVPVASQVGESFNPNNGTNPTGYIIKYRNPSVVIPQSVIPGIPTVYTQHGDSLIIGFSPDTNYATQQYYQIEHPFVGDDTGNNYKDIANTLIRMPNDWREILEYAAAEKGCDIIGMTDVGILYHQKLYGNPSKQLPGIIAERLTQQKRDTGFNERRLKPTMRRYIR